MTDEVSKIYIVVCYGGEWDDAWEHNVQAFSTLEKAEALVQELEQSVPEYSEYIDRLEERICRIATRMADLEFPPPRSTPSEWEAHDEIYYSITESLFDKMNDKYPDLTGDPNDPDIYYTIREVEYGG